jgi:archaeal preflagellin peptidase FlaK
MYFYFTYLSYFIAFLTLLIAAYTDIRKREVSNKLLLIVFVITLTINIFVTIYYFNIFPINYLIFICIVFVTCYFLWSLGIFAGGDAKLLICIAALIPYQTQALFSNTFSPFAFVISLFLLAAFINFPIGAFLSIKALIKRSKFLFYLKKELIKKSRNLVFSVLVIISLYLVLSFFALPKLLIIPLSILSGFVNFKIRFPLSIVFFVWALIINPLSNLKLILIIVVISYIAWFIFKLFWLTKNGILNYNKPISKLEEGDLLAYSLMQTDLGLEEYRYSLFIEIKTILRTNKIPEWRFLLAKAFRKQKHLKRQIVINNRFAGGLEKKEVDLIKMEYCNKEIELKKTVAFVPSLLVSYIIMILFGDILWFLII